MRGNLPKLTVTIGVATILIGLIALGRPESRLRADEEDYPEWKDTTTKIDEYCPFYNNKCQSCNGGTFVYGAIPAAPATGYNQGSCMAKQGGGGSCIGTYYTCIKRFCSSGNPVYPGENLYSGNWCKPGA